MEGASILPRLFGLERGSNETDGEIRSRRNLLVAQQLKLRATHGKTSLRRLNVQSAQADFAVCCPQF